MFTNDSRTENFLTALGVKFEYVNGVLFPQEFAPSWDKENLGRPVAVREDAVIEYATLMESGSAAPAPIVHRSDEGLRVLDGVQRLSAALLNQITRVSVYIVQTGSEDLLATIRVMANARLQGRAEPPEWTRRRAIEILVVGRGLSPAEVAQMGGWKPADVKRIAESIELQERITAASGPELPDNLLAELRPYVHGTTVLENAVEPVIGFLHVLKKSRISVSDAEPYITAFFAQLPRGSKPHATYTGRLKSIQEDPEIRARITGRQTTELPKDVVFLRELKSAETALDGLIALGGRVNNVDEFFRILSSITKKLKDLAPNKKPQEARVPADLWSDKK